MQMHRFFVQKYWLIKSKWYDDYGIKQKRRILKKKIKWLKRIKTKRNCNQLLLLLMMTTTYLSAGVCGPDGCEIDWSKAKKNVQDDQK